MAMQYTTSHIPWYTGILGVDRKILLEIVNMSDKNSKSLNDPCDIDDWRKSFLLRYGCHLDEYIQKSEYEYIYNTYKDLDDTKKFIYASQHGHIPLTVLYIDEPTPAILGKSLCDAIRRRDLLVVETIVHNSSKITSKELIGGLRIAINCNFDEFYEILAMSQGRASQRGMIPVNSDGPLVLNIDRY